MNNPVKKVLIVGGGTAGWMAAAAMTKFIEPHNCQIQLVESDQTPTVGVGEATIPQIQLFNRSLGIDENDFVKSTQATFKLGIEFINWGQVGDKYTHAFGDVGRDMHALQFYHFWWKMRQKNQADDIGKYTLNTVASNENKFMRPVNAGDSPLSNIAYAFQFDAGLYAKFLKERAKAQGAIHTTGHIESTTLNAQTGFIQSVTLTTGETLEADLFIDCSGFQGLLIEKALHTEYEDWSHWLPCDSAWTVPCKSHGPLTPYTRATAHSAGWQWRIPLQNRTGNGHVFSSQHMSEEDAKTILLHNIDGNPLAEARLIKFTTGKRKQIWNKNCVSLGLSSGFMEPLESTSIHLIQSAISRIMAMFPTKEFHHSLIDEFNRNMDFEYTSIRDFIILHYKATQREDSSFWRYCKNMDIPKTLAHKIETFKSTGILNRQNNELFGETSWLEVLQGQGIQPKCYHPLTDNIPDKDIIERLDNIKRVIAKSAEHMPLHSEFIEKTCKAPTIY